jgi:hypothetical protein
MHTEPISMRERWRSATSRARRYSWVGFEDYVESLGGFAIVYGLYMTFARESVLAHVLAGLGAVATSLVLTPAISLCRRFATARGDILEERLALTRLERDAALASLAAQAAGKSTAYSTISELILVGQDLSTTAVTSQTEFDEWKNSHTQWIRKVHDLRSASHIAEHDWLELRRVTYNPNQKYAHEFNAEHRDLWHQLNERLRILAGLQRGLRP